MTVKAQGGKVITKGGKVSCSCCGESECCMYPAQAFVGGLYTVDDLPDALDYSGTNAPVTLNKLSTPEQSNRFDGIAYFRGEYEFSGQQAIVDLGIQEDIWKLGDSLNDQATTTSFCLIDDFRTKDQFADTYTVSWPESTPGGPFPAGSDVVERVSLCEWLGSKVKLNYKGFSEQFGDIFNFQISEIDSGGDVFKDRLEGEYANTPIGFYFHGGAADLTFLQLGATVS